MKVKTPSLKGKGPSLKGKGPSLKGKGKASASGQGLERQAQGPQGPADPGAEFVSDLYRDLRDRGCCCRSPRCSSRWSRFRCCSASSGPRPCRRRRRRWPIATRMRGGPVRGARRAGRHPQLPQAPRGAEEEEPFEQKFTLPEAELRERRATAPPTPARHLDRPSDTDGRDPTGATASSGGGDARSTETDRLHRRHRHDRRRARDRARAAEARDSLLRRPYRRHHRPARRRQDLDGVRYLDFLPNDKRPVVAFLGLGEGGEQAVFSISSDVVESDGEGSCAPKLPAPCQFLTLKIGEQRTFNFVDGDDLPAEAARHARGPDPRSARSDRAQQRGSDRRQGLNRPARIASLAVPHRAASLT